MSSKLRKSKHLSASKMKASLKKLEKEDPELVKFMKASDSSIFEFDESSTSEEEEDAAEQEIKNADVSENGDDNDDDEDDDDEDDDDDDDDGEDNDDNKIHQLPKKLKTASDSDSEDEDSSRTSSGKKKRLVTKQMIRHWAKLMQERNSIPAMQDLMLAFRSAVQQSKADGEEEISTKFKVEGTAVFNAVVSTSIVEIPTFLKRFLDVKEPKDSNSIVLPSTANKWKRVKADVRTYVTDLLQLLTQMASTDVLTVLLKHVHQMIIYFACFPKLPKLLLKRLIVLWSTSEETVRLLAFLCIMRLVLLLPDALLEFSLKHMYKAYVNNCKFTSVNTLHLINFMRRSLIEMFGVRLDLSYHFAFIYIRQLAIHLRNAITLQKKESTQTVYNWQFVHSLFLWTRLMCAHHADESIHSLIYPLTQIIIGTIKLIPTASYYPLRFHCVRALNMISESTGVYIPVLPFLTEVIDSPELKRKPKTAAAKAYVFECLLKLTKPQLRDKAFQDGVLEQVYELMLLHMNIHSHSLGFPELVIPTVMQVKKFLKMCKLPAHVKKLKQLLDKIDEASKVVVQRRKKSNINLRDTAAVTAWEQKNKAEGNPLSTFVTNYKKLKERQAQTVNHSQMLGSDLPKIERKGPKKVTSDERAEFDDLFKSSDEESDSEDEKRFMLKEERPQQKKDDKESKATDMSTKSNSKKRKLEDSESESEYSDFDDEELDRLNKSASEDDDDDDDDDNDDDDDDDDDSGDDKSDNENESDDNEDDDNDADDVVKDFSWDE